MGIPPEAENFISRYKLVRVPSGRGISMAVYGETVNLADYYYPGAEPDENGITKHEPLLSEVEQCTPWSSGPCYFIKLVDKYNRDVFSWSEEEVENCYNAKGRF
jgi:hypothetical protein